MQVPEEKLKPRSFEPLNFSRIFQLIDIGLILMFSILGCCLLAILPKFFSVRRELGIHEDSTLIHGLSIDNLPHEPRIWILICLVLILGMTLKSYWLNYNFDYLINLSAFFVLLVCISIQIAFSLLIAFDTIISLAFLMKT